MRREGEAGGLARVRMGLAVLAAWALTMALAPGEAPARDLVTGFSDDLYRSGDDATRNLWFDNTVASGAGIVRVNLIWRTVSGNQKPDSPRDPSDPAYSFGPIDAAVREANQRDLDVLLTVTRAPDWAEGPSRPGSVAPGTWKPDAQAYGDFAHAVAERYSGAFPGLEDAGVRYYQAWNETNLSTYLTPQYQGESPQSPDIYRRLLNSFYEEVSAVSPENLVVSAGLAPYGEPPGGTRMRPLVFFRELLCLKNRNKLNPVKCPTKAKADILAHHPINTSGGPRESAFHPDDVSTPDLVEVRRTLRAAERHDRILPGGASPRPLWVTEFWWESDPPDTFADVGEVEHARYIEEALYLFWKQGASAAINLQIVDNPCDPNPSSGSNPCGSQPPPDGDRYRFQTGIHFADGQRKTAFQAFRFPFVSERLSEAKDRAWGSPPAAGNLVIEKRKGGGGWRQLEDLNVDARTPFTRKLQVKGEANLRAVVGAEQSLTWHQGGGR